MSDLVCIAYKERDTADQVLNELRQLEVEHLIDLEVTPEKVLPHVAKFGGTILKTSLSPEQDERLREVLSAAA
jgi:uncharacterized membrane protein